VSASPAVGVDRVSKHFVISRRRGAGVKDRALGLLRGEARERETLWALRDVSLDIPRGATFGLIGHNGSGKSTLLQLVAGILEPDAGSIRVDGRVTSLLELGAGFSPELTGRENVFLNASLHGFSRADITPRFDAIVAFAELERFIDMPVRTYSSGMYVRLGFAVAVHLEPQVILIDEAFAVGDERFQRKCLHTIREFQARGVTIVLVSHDLILVEQLASQAALLDHGELAAVGAPADVIGRYHELGLGHDHAAGARRWGSGEIEITGLDVLSDGARVTGAVRTRDPLTLRLHYRCAAAVSNPVFGLAIHRDDGVHLTGPNTRLSGVEMGVVEGEGTLDYTIPRLPLLPGRYYLSAAVYDRDLITAYDHRDRFRPLVVIEGGTAERFGVIELDARWSVGAHA
jgi:ABC-type polysaccharide/polyol phosphate transport system ATPase subunit